LAIQASTMSNSALMASFTASRAALFPRELNCSAMRHNL
jgi:hypothetical protein